MNANSPVPDRVRSALNEPYSLTHDQITFYRENAYIKLRDVLPVSVLDFFESAITETVMALKKDRGPMEERDTYGRAFIQVANLWRQNEVVKQLVTSPRLGRIATELMEVDGVRLYHDQALYKEPGGGFTPWHADQFYWPLATDRCVTAWIPLQPTPLEMGPLEFSPASQRLQEGRDLQISDESEDRIADLLEAGQHDRAVEPFDAGEVSFHAGWLYHRAGPNRTAATRKVMTIIYMDQDMTLMEPDSPYRAADRDAWCPGIAVNEVIDSPLNPLIHSSAG